MDILYTGNSKARISTLLLIPNYLHFRQGKRCFFKGIPQIYFENYL